MRLWSLHPRYLDPQGLVALWRESLLAKKVLQGRTRGYRQHPQLARFKNARSPVASINEYLRSVWEEAARRGYCFDKRNLGRAGRAAHIVVSSGQLEFEIDHLRRKLRRRNVVHLAQIAGLKKPSPHPLFKVRPGGVAPWEKTPASARPRTIGRSTP